MEEKIEIYSHSRLWLYENCPEYFKIKYLDKALPDLPVSMALFLGGMIHESLEWLYHQTKNRKNAGYNSNYSHAVNNYWKYPKKCTCLLFSQIYHKCFSSF